LQVFLRRQNGGKRAKEKEKKGGGHQGFFDMEVGREGEKRGEGKSVLGSENFVSKNGRKEKASKRKGRGGPATCLSTHSPLGQPWKEEKKNKRKGLGRLCFPGHFRFCRKVEIGGLYLQEGAFDGREGRRKKREKRGEKRGLQDEFTYHGLFGLMNEMSSRGRKRERRDRLEFPKAQIGKKKKAATESFEPNSRHGF